MPFPFHPEDYDDLWDERNDPVRDIYADDDEEDCDYDPPDGSECLTVEERNPSLVRESMRRW